MSNGNGASAVPAVRLHPQSTWIPLGLVMTICTVIVGAVLWVTTERQQDATNIKLLYQRMDALEKRFEASQDDWQALFRRQQEKLDEIGKTIVGVRMSVDRLIQKKLDH